MRLDHLLSKEQEAVPLRREGLLGRRLLKSQAVYVLSSYRVVSSSRPEHPGRVVPHSLPGTADRAAGNDRGARSAGPGAGPPKSLGPIAQVVRAHA